ncbi:hypothetical protein Tco_0616230 [Tanacetum coccineum]
MQVSPEPIATHSPSMDPPQKGPPLMVLPLRSYLGQPPEGPPQKVISLCLTLVYSLVKLEPLTAQSASETGT